MNAPKHNRKLIEQLTQERDEALADLRFESKAFEMAQDTHQLTFARLIDVQQHPWRNLWNWIRGR